MNCLICNKYLKSGRAFPGHIKAAHKITVQEYYDLYVKKPDEGICIECGKPTRFCGIVYGYKQYCSLKCATPHIQEQYKKTLMSKYGVTNMSQIPEVKEKIKSTMNERYGVDYFCTTKKCLDAGHTDETKNKQKQTCLTNYGVTCGFKTEKCKERTHTKEANLKREQTCLSKFNRKSALPVPTKESIQKGRQTMLKRFGYDHNFKRPEVKLKVFSADSLEKRHISRKQNGWCHSSIEENFKLKLSELNIDYKHNYKTDVYPYKCDFYIESLDLYIEINAFWGHNFHFYDKNNKQDVLYAKKWLESDKEFYKYAYKIWTYYDIIKKEIALSNNLNYVVLWNQDQVDQFLNDIQIKEFNGFIDYNELERIN